MKGPRSLSPSRRLRVRPSRSSSAPDASGPTSHIEVAKTVFFLGAGASAAVTAPPVLTSTLLRLALNNPSQETPDQAVNDVRRVVASLGSQESPPTVDDLLDVLDYAIHRRISLSRAYDAGTLSGVRSSLLRLIYDFVDHAVHRQNNDSGFNPYVRLIKHWGRRRPLAVVSLNWDCLIEYAFLSTVPMGRAGSIDYGADFLNYGGPTHGVNPGSLLVLKPHGSLSWRYCPLCGQLTSFLTSRLSAVGERWACDLCAGHVLEPVLIPPSTARSSHPWLLSSIWERIERAIRDSSQIVFVGYSFPSQDTDVRVHLLRGMAQRSNAPPVIQVVNIAQPKPQQALERSRYLSLLGGSGAAFAWYYKGFANWVKETCGE